jgi:hypothetical protein
MASPHVAGIVALMAEKNNALTATQAEGYPRVHGAPLPAGCRDVYQPSGALASICWNPMQRALASRMRLPRWTQSRPDFVLS